MRRLALCGLLAVACTDAELVEIPAPPPAPRDDKLLVDGRVCPRASESLDFPLRVLFVVDGSESMEITDPIDPVTGETQRQAAVREAWTRLLAEGAPGTVKIGITRFSAQAQSRTVVDADADGLPDSFFTDDPELLEVATASLAATDRTTNYLNALDEAYLELRTELLRADEASVARSRYAVIFVSDGLPDESGTEGRRNTAGAIVDAVGALVDLAALFGVGDFAVHTVYLSAGRGPVVDQPAQDLLGAMAEAGEGVYRSVPSGEALRFLYLDLTRIQRVYALRSIAAVNLHALQASAQIGQPVIPAFDDAAYKDVDGDGAPSCGDPLLDSDGDGLADLRERRVGTDPFDPDTDRDGAGDRLEVLLGASGLDPLDPDDSGCRVQDLVADRPGCLDADADLRCDCGPDSEDADGDGRCDDPDTDGDGLNDCEEVYLGTSRTAADTDGDGLPDLIEIRAGTSPVAADEADDLDWDRTLNGFEVRSAGDPWCDDAPSRSQGAYSWTLEEEPGAGPAACMRFRLDHVTLLPTADPANPGRNRVLIYAGEAAYDDPGDFAGWRVACVEARYLLEGDRKTPPSGRMEVTDADFVDARDFDPAVHCVVGL